MNITAAVVPVRSAPFEIETLDLAAPLADEVLVRVVASGMCHTDLHARDGYFPNLPYPVVCGHEGAGIIEQVGADVIAPKVREHRGRIVKHTGDGALVEFGSVVGAVRCALDVQRIILARNAGLPQDRRIDLRIGVNLGDVIVAPDDIYGHGVNIAARLESLAPPGGICISADVWRHVRGAIAADFVDLGEQRLKNIADPAHVFAVSLAA